MAEQWIAAHQAYALVSDTQIRCACHHADLFKLRASRKRPCASGTLFCLHCPEPRQPALCMVDFLPMTPTSGKLRAICSG
jgi:hypothetical protein